MEEATITNTNPQQVSGPPELTTDDLVLMIGEFHIKDRQNQRVIPWLQNQIEHWHKEAIKYQSLHAGEMAARNNSESQSASCADQLQQREKQYAASISGYQARILQLEDMVHDTALERDAAREEVAKLKRPLESVPVNAKKETTPKPKKEKSEWQ